MKVKQVEYRKLVTGPGYNNETYGVVVEVEDGDTEESAIQYARGTVENWFDERKELQVAKDELQQVQWRASELHREIQRRESRIKGLVDYEAKIRERLGVPMPEDDIPF